MAVFERRQGEHLIVKNGLDLDGVAITLSAYSCSIDVVSVVDGSSVLQRAVTELSDADTKFVTRITPAEMAAIAPGDYKLVTQISNSSAGFDYEYQDILTVSPQIIS